MLDPKKLEQACRDALAYIEIKCDNLLVMPSIVEVLRDALSPMMSGCHARVGADESRSHRPIRYSEKECQVVECSCGERFIVPKSADAPTWHDAQIVVGKKWLLHLEEMRIRGLLF